MPRTYQLTFRTAAKNFCSKNYQFLNISNTTIWTTRTLVLKWLFTAFSPQPFLPNAKKCLKQTKIITISNFSDPSNAPYTPQTLIYNSWSIFLYKHKVKLFEPSWQSSSNKSQNSIYKVTIVNLLWHLLWNCSRRTILLSKYLLDVFVWFSANCRSKASMILNYLSTPTKS